MNCGSFFDFSLQRRDHADAGRSAPSQRDTPATGTNTRQGTTKEAHTLAKASLLQRRPATDPSRNVRAPTAQGGRVQLSVRSPRES